MVALLALAVGVAVAVLAMRPDPTAARRSVGGDRTKYGNTIELSAASGILRDCNCPGLPTAGRASSGNVVRAWEKGKDFGFVFSGGLTLSYEATSETPEGFIKRIDASIKNPDEAGPIGRLVSLRGTQVRAKESDEHGPAFVEWVEGRRELTLVGGVEQQLTVLLEAAR